MTHSPVPRRSFLAGAVGLVTLGATGCGSSSNTSSGSASTAAATASTPPTSTAPTSTAAGSAATPTLASLVSQVRPTFEQATYADATTGKTLPYNIYLPDDYDSSKTYPLVLFITDATLVGQAVTAPLSQYGALIWASSQEQAKHQSIVLAPEYPEVIIDHRSGHTVTPYVEMTRRLLAFIAARYSVDPERVHGTGQSMGCLATLLLAAEHPDLFAAELFVSGQWAIDQLHGLSTQKFVYIAAGGDPSAPAGQVAVEKLLRSDGVPFQTATWDATWSASRTASVPGSSACSRVLPSPSVFTVSRSAVSVGGADSENGCAVSHRSGVRNRQRRNCPDSARSSSRSRPSTTIDTTPGPSGRTAATRIRWRPAWRSGVGTRWVSTSANTPV